MNPMNPMSSVNSWNSLKLTARGVRRSGCPEAHPALSFGGPDLHVCDTTDRHDHKPASSIRQLEHPVGLAERRLDLADHLTAVSVLGQHDLELLHRLDDP